MAESSTDIFRAAALERLSSPDQLDQLSSLPSPLERAALYALAAIMLAAFAWSVLSTIPTWVAGKGILVSQGGHLFNATAPATGTLVSVAPIGTIVHKGDLIAQLDASALRQDRDNAQQVVEEKRATRAKTAERYARQIRLAEQNVAQRKINLARISDTAQQSVVFYSKLLAQEEGYQKHGAVTPLTVQETRQKMSQADADGRAARGEMLRLEAEQQDLENRRDAELRQADEAVYQAQRRAGEVALQLERATRVLSPLAGVVTEVDVTAGSLIAAGKPLASIEAAGEGLELLLYIPPEQGKKVRPGMAVNIEPATVRKEEFGTLTGRVLSVSDYPMTADGMQSILQNAQLVTSFMASGPPYQTRVTLVRRPGTVSGYAWSSRGGPALRLTSGTTAAAEIVVRTQPPITLLLPALLSWTGGDH